MQNIYLQKYFLVLFSLLPLSIILGSSISLLNIILIDLSFLILIFFKKDFSFIKNETIVYLFILYIYLIFNSFISLDIESGLARNLGFIRIIIFFLAINYFFRDKKFSNKVFLSWLVIFIIMILDVFLESFTGKNILGYGGEIHGRRIVSFFRDEPIVGGFLNAFYLILVGYLFDKFKNEKGKLVFLFSAVFFTAIFLTGERSNTIRALIASFLFYSFFKEYGLKQKLIILVTSVIIIITFILNSQYLKLRYFEQIQATIQKDHQYFKLYKSGYEVFKNNKIFGVGSKNYRIETCGKAEEQNDSSKNYICTTHPHQIYLEFLSEHGLFGTIFIIFIFFKLILSKAYSQFKELNYIQIGSLIYLFITFLPLLPSGSFFSDYLITLFGLNLAIFYATNSKLNIFDNTDKKV